MPKFEKQLERLMAQKEKDKQAEDIPLSEEFPISEKDYLSTKEEVAFLTKKEDSFAKEDRPLSRKKAAKKTGDFSPVYATVLHTVRR